MDRTVLYNMNIHRLQRSITEERICKVCKKKYFAYKEPYKIKRNHRGVIRRYDSVTCSSVCSIELKNHRYRYDKNGGLK